ncbi:hypothetical protein DAPK24_018900 [Pichia kluyveri]|uniref:Knr4/Smi1-like domain-containing protein n=1 Tax=Pichia kluyveri TaxID=36015 RepID=A0AAV5R200_PICKL|nr:hypothetical protein DAPK24_018900 [Pichia kluyveri]
MSFFKNVKEFFHNVTTSDHYAQYDATGGVNNSNNLGSSKGSSPKNGLSPMNGSTTSLNNMKNNNNNINVSTTSLVSHNRPQTGSSSKIPYRPGMKSQLHNDSQIELRNYENGQPIRDIFEIWEKIDDWLDTEFPELGDDIQGGATVNDLNAFENDLNITLPTTFRESYQIHDGQVSMGKTRGLIFDYQLMDLEAIAAETNIWRRVYEKYENNNGNGNVNNNEKKFGIQKSCPPNFINEIYYDPLWIPFVKDNVGNNIAIDLNPNIEGKWGQIILFGRDYNTKFVVADSFSEFLSNVCNEFEDDHYEIDEDECLNYMYNGKNYNYFDVLKSKSIQRAKKIDSSYELVEKKTNDADLLMKKQRNNTNNVNTNTILNTNSAKTGLNIKREDETLPNETIISPNIIKKERDFTPSKENVATNDSFVIDDDVLSVEELEEPVEPTSTEINDEENKPVEDNIVEQVVNELKDTSIKKAEPKEEVTEEVTKEASEEITKPVAELKEEVTEEVTEPVVEPKEEVSEPVSEPVEETEATEEVEEGEEADTTASDVNASKKSSKKKNKKKNKK